MLTQKPSIFIQQLILVGRRKNYIVPFSSGVNIIYGDSATGKSSVLECINYLFGSSVFVYDREIESSVLYVQMEVSLNGAVYVIKRDIFNVNAEIEVYYCDIQSIGSIFPLKLSPNLQQEGRDGYFSDFMLAALNVPNLKTKQAPTKTDSPMVRLSFRDLFKFCYLKQDDVGSKGLLGDGGYAAVKNKETFKYIFNLLDTNISDLQEELAVLTGRARDIEVKYSVVSEFLRTAEFKSEADLDDDRRGLEIKRQAASVELSRINGEITSNNESYLILRDTLKSFVTKISFIESELIELDSAVDRYVRLKNDYKNDIERLKSIRVAESLIGDLRETFSCPLCDSSVSLESIKSGYSISDGDRVLQEVNMLTRRIKDIDFLVQKDRNKRIEYEKELQSLIQDRDNARRMIDEEMHSMISPYLTERDAWSSELIRIDEQKRVIEHAVKVRNQQKVIFKDLLDAQDKIGGIQIRLKELIAKAPALQEVLKDLGDSLFKYLKYIKISDLRDVSISAKTFLPILRNRDYRDITSGGLRTILSIGYFLVILRHTLSLNLNLPSFLMIDTVGKYLGKTQQKNEETDVVEDAREGVSDPKKYLNVYESMFRLSEIAKENGVVFQIIVVDNDIPPQVQASRPESIVAYFNNEGEKGARRGLIDDAHLYR